ncbi:hypothetical protein C2S51_022741 [Perilla frutescens var. frutescens]|nr:hypothetical protein C2S51_022741 [Perilla frutescens var. frutescens]
MESKRIAPITMTLFVGFVCLVLLSTTSDAAGSEDESWALQGPCSKFPDCNAYCIKIGYVKYGGKCVRLVPTNNDPMVCVCIAQN